MKKNEKDFKKAERMNVHLFITKRSCNKKNIFDGELSIVKGKVKLKLHFYEQTAFEKMLPENVSKYRFFFCNIGILNYWCCLLRKLAELW